MTSFVGGIPKEIRTSIKWLKNKNIKCSYCKKDISKFRFLWIDSYLNILCGCPGYHFAIRMKCYNCNRFKDMAKGKSGQLLSFCPKCLT